jgi:hypothetical protein
MQCVRENRQRSASVYSSGANPKRCRRQERRCFKLARISRLSPIVRYGILSHLTILIDGLEATMKRVPSVWLAEHLRIADIQNGERLWAFTDAIAVDNEATVWINRQYSAHGRRLPGMVEIRRDGEQLHVRMPRKRYRVQEPPRFDDKDWIPATTIEMFWSPMCLLGF